MFSLLCATRFAPLASRHSLRATRFAPLASRHSLRATRFAPLASRPKCNGFVAVIAATSLALLCPRPAAAQSGTWDFSNDVFHSESKEVNGVNKSYSGGDKALYYLNQENLEDYYTVGPTTSYPAFGYVPVPVTNGNANGSILLRGRDRIIAYWTPSSSGSSGAPGGSPPPPSGTPTPVPTPPAPPETVTILVNASTTASFSDGSVDQLNPSASLDNGFGDPTIVISNDSANKRWASQGLHLKTLSTQNRAWIPPQTINGYTTPGKWKIELPLDINLSASITGEGTNFNYFTRSAGNILAQLGGLSTTGDTRGVKITRAGAPPVKPKTDSSFDEKTDEWEDIVNGQWVGHGHSRYSWEVPYDSMWMKLQPVTQTFQRSLVGDWSTSTTLTGTWTPEGNVDKPMGSEQIMPTGSPYKDGVTTDWKGSLSGTKPHKVTLKIKDPDKNLSAEATYELTLHDEFEKIGSPEAVLPSSGEKFTTYAWLWGSDSNGNGKLMIIEGEGTDPNNVPDESGITISQGRATTSGLTAVGGVDFNLVKDLIGVNASVEFSYSVTNELGRGFPLGSNLKTGEHAAPVAYWTYNKYRQKLRQWESSGVSKETYTEYNVPTGDGIQWRVWDTTKTQDPVPGTPVYPK